MNPDHALLDARQEEDRSEEVLLTINEYASARRVTRRTVERWLRAGHLAAERIGPHGQWRIKCRSLSDSQAH